MDTLELAIDEMRHDADSGFSAHSKSPDRLFYADMLILSFFGKGFLAAAKAV